TARAQGISVRACVQNLAGGDRKAMLRYQNKYRSVLKTRPGMVREIMEEIANSGESAFDPYAAQMTQARPLYDGITKSIQNSGDPALLGLLRGLNTLLSRADMMEAAPLRKACEDMVLSVKEFLGQPQEERARELGAFCVMLSEHVNAVENAL
ncbi:MAG: hypothetical protein LBN04_06275, partial [Oscillospiraceae bacterium]|nr:hypothetical protein [Oscillospiraceae bacterium]